MSLCGINIPVRLYRSSYSSLEEPGAIVKIKIDMRDGLRACECERASPACVSGILKRCFFVSYGCYETKISRVIKYESNPSSNGHTGDLRASGHPRLCGSKKSA